MKVNEKYGWKGKVNISIMDVVTGKTENKVIYNRLMDNALDEIIKCMYLVTSSDMLLKHVAIGDDDTSNNDSMTALVNEIYRVPIVNRLKTGTGEFETRGVLLDTEPPDLSGACTIKEFGFFAGSNSGNWNDGDGKDTGLMISRVVLSSPWLVKTNTKQINFTRTDEFTRG